MNADGLARAAIANIVTHFSWVQSRIDGMHVQLDDHLVLVDSGLPCDTFNVVCRARLATDQALKQINAALHYFQSVQRPFSWWHNPGDYPDNLGALLLDAGLQVAESELAMAVALDQLRIGDRSPEGLQIKRVSTIAQLQDFATIVAANWTPPDVQVNQFYDLAASVVLTAASPLWFYVGYLNDVPVAAAEMTVHEGTVGLYSICTLQAYRGRGFGSALTLLPLMDAQQAGKQRAILQAAAAGVNIYKRLGFETFGEITEYKPANINDVSGL